MNNSTREKYVLLDNRNKIPMSRVQSDLSSPTSVVHARCVVPLRDKSLATTVEVGMDGIIRCDDTTSAFSEHSGRLEIWRNLICVPWTRPSSIVQIPYISFRSRTVWGCNDGLRSTTRSTAGALLRPSSHAGSVNTRTLSINISD